MRERWEVRETGKRERERERRHKDREKKIERVF